MRMKASSNESLMPKNGCLDCEGTNAKRECVCFLLALCRPPAGMSHRSTDFMVQGVYLAIFSLLTKDLLCRAFRIWIQISTAAEWVHTRILPFNQATLLLSTVHKIISNYLHLPELTDTVILATSYPSAVKSASAKAGSLKIGPPATNPSAIETPAFSSSPVLAIV